MRRSPHKWTRGASRREKKSPKSLFPPSKLFTHSREKELLDTEDCRVSELSYLQPSEHEFMLLISEFIAIYF